MSDRQPLLSVEDLRVSFATEEGIVQAVDRRVLQVEVAAQQLPQRTPRRDRE